MIEASIKPLALDSASNITEKVMQHEGEKMDKFLEHFAKDSGQCYAGKEIWGQTKVERRKLRHEPKNRVDFRS